MKAENCCCCSCCSCFFVVVDVPVVVVVVVPVVFVIVAVVPVVVVVVVVVVAPVVVVVPFVVVLISYAFSNQHVWEHCQKKVHQLCVPQSTCMGMRRELLFLLLFICCGNRSKDQKRK